MTQPLTVFLADDQSLVRSGFRMLIDAEDDWVAPTVADRNRIKAIRIAVIARNSLWERDVVSTACSSTTDPPDAAAHLVAPASKRSSTEMLSSGPKPLVPTKAGRVASTGVSSHSRSTANGGALRVAATRSTQVVDAAVPAISSRAVRGSVANTTPSALRSSSDSTLVFVCTSTPSDAR